MSKLKVFLMVGLVGSLLLLTTASLASQLAPPKAGTKLQFAACASAETVPMRDIIKLYNKTFGVNVNFIELPYTTLYEKVLTNLQARTGAYDIVMLDDPWMPMFAGGEYLINLSDRGYSPDPGILQKSLDLCLWPPPHGPRTPGTPKEAEPDLYGLPSVADVQMFFYRKDILPGPPETWDQYKAFCEIYAKPEEGFYGYVHRGVRGNPVVTNWFPFLYSMGGAIFDEDWNVTVNNKEGIEALELFIEMKKYAPKGVANYDSDEVGTTFLGGNSLASIMWAGWAVQTQDPQQSKVIGKVGFTVAPRKVRHAVEIGNWLLGISHGSKKVDAALHFIDWLCGYKGQFAFAENGGSPVVGSVLYEPKLALKYPWFPVIAMAIESSVWRPRTPEWAQTEDILGTYLSMALAEQISPEEALNKATQEIGNHMKKMGY